MFQSTVPAGTPERASDKARLFQQVDGAINQEHLLELLQRRALTNDTMPEARVEELRLEMERAEAQRLQPCHVQSFFVAAFRHLGGRLKRREEGRWEITHVPAILRERDRQIGAGAAIQRRYERICFEKDRINQQPVAAFVYPGQPLLEAVISVVREKYDYLMKQGAVFVDDSDIGEALSVVVLLEHDVRDGRPLATGRPHIVSEKLQFAAIGPDGNSADAGIAPHLNLRPARLEEVALVDDLLAGGLYGQVNGHRRKVTIRADGHDPCLDAVVIVLATQGQTGMIGAAIQPLGRNEEDGTVGINESKLTKGQVRKLNGLRKSVGDELAEEVFGKWLAQQASAAAAPKSDPVAVKIEESLAGYADDGTFKLGNYGYTIRRARGKGATGFVATKNEKPR